VPHQFEHALYGNSGSRNTGLPEMDIGVNCDSLLHDFRLHVLLPARPCTEKPIQGMLNFLVATEDGDAPLWPPPDYQTILIPETKRGLAISRKILHFCRLPDQIGQPGKTSRPYASSINISPMTDGDWKNLNARSLFGRFTMMDMAFIAQPGSENASTKHLRLYRDRRPQ